MMAADTENVAVVVDVVKLYEGVRQAIYDSLQNDGLRLIPREGQTHAPAVTYLASKIAADIANRLGGMVAMRKLVEESIQSVVGPTHTYGGDRDNMSHEIRPWPSVHTDTK